MTVDADYDFSKFVDLKVPKTVKGDKFFLHARRSIISFSFVQGDDCKSDGRDEIFTVSCLKELLDGVAKQAENKQPGAQLKIRICSRMQVTCVFSNRSNLPNLVPLHRFDKYIIF